MVRDLRIGARERGDKEVLWREAAKRNAWMWENALRRHNFVGFVGEVLKGVVRGKLGSKGGDGEEDGEKAYLTWVDEAKKRRELKREGKAGKEVGG
jgi:ubiquitin carboxyl-terminal hydrolase L5